ncbi:MAG TPA: hypothetical protein VHW23_37235 [Kofleriaceae bacterium]|jgi:hypothetical protein|nr:hypothetical protein [Kofleriaceae bacterium]
MYRDDDAARTERSIALVNEIAELERQKLASAALEDRLDAARRELCGLQSQSTSRPPDPGLVTHLVVFGAAAAVAFLGYALAFR